MVGTFVLSFALFSNVDAQQNAMRPTPILEIYACNFKDNMDMGDFRSAATRFNAWADRHTVKDYSAFIATPYVFSTDLTYDTLWLGAWPNGAAMGAGETLYMTRPTLNTYTATRADLVATAKDLFEVVGSGAVKINVNHKYALKDAAQAHKDLEGRKTTGSIILLP